MQLYLDNVYKNYIASQNPLGKKVFLYVVMLAAAATALALYACIYERSHAGTDASVLFRDPNALANNPAYFGFFSNIGVLCWSIAASVSMFTGYVMMHRKGYFGFFLMGGCLSALLGLDDLFMIHEYVLPHLGIPEIFSYLCEGLLLLALLWVYRGFILKRFWLPLFCALSVLSFSVLLDSLPPFRAQTTIEDSIKLIGVLFWAYYFTSMSFSMIREMSDPESLAKNDLDEAAISTSGLL